jgi:hypothetical protein
VRSSSVEVIDLEPSAAAALPARRMPARRESGQKTQHNDDRQVAGATRAGAQK